RSISLDRVEDVNDEARALQPAYTWRATDKVSCLYRYNKDQSVDVMPLTAEAFAVQIEYAKQLLEDASGSVSYFQAPGSSLSHFSVFLLNLLEQGVSVHLFSAKETLENLKSAARHLASRRNDSFIMPLEFHRALKKIDRECAALKPLVL